MKLPAVYLVTFLSLLIAINADQAIPSFLKSIGSYKYNNTDNGKITVKRYYSSQRITYKWIDAFMICKSAGMRLALIETEDELNNLAAMGRRNAKLFEKKVFVNGYNLTVEYDYESERSEAEPCYSLLKYRKRKLEIRSERCNSEANKFLCEQAEVVDTYTQLGDDAVDVRATFFKNIGNFEGINYYASFKLKAYSNDVPKICQSFGMQMVAPRNQAEYDNFGNLLQKFDDDWKSVSISGYRSEENDSEWLVSNKKVNYVMDWNEGEPNNHGGGEDCIALKNMGQPKMNDIPCRSDDQFVCELRESSTDDVPLVSTQIDPMFLKPLTEYNIGSMKKELFVSVYDVDWIAAKLVCRNYGMELFTPSSAAEDDLVRKRLQKLAGISETLHVGITSMGTADVWYSVNSGKILDFDLEWAPQYSNYYPDNSNCLKLRRSYEKYSYDVETCTNQQSDFLCQRVVEITEDVQNITSTSPATTSNENDVAATGMEVDF